MSFSYLTYPISSSIGITNLFTKSLAADEPALPVRSIRTAIANEGCSFIFSPSLIFLSELFMKQM